MKLLHMRPYGFDVGSVYKYGEMFSRVTTVKDAILPSINAPVEDVKRILEKEKPDAVIMRGDRWPMWQAAADLGVPYILDAHDMHNLRVPATEAAKFNERGQIESAAAIIFTSPDHQEYANINYKVPPSRVVHLRPTAAALDFEPMRKLKGKHIVYAGGVTELAARDNIYGYRSYGVSIFPALIEAGWTVHVYPCYFARDEVKKEYASLGCVIHDEVPEYELPRVLSQYTVGYQGYANDDCPPVAFNYCMTCRPNKLWTYLSAGIPTVGFQGGNGMRLYDGSWGVVTHSLDELGAAADEAASMKITDDLRRSQVIDGDEPLFRELVAITEDSIAREHELKKLRPLTYPVQLSVNFGTHKVAGRVYRPGDRVTKEEAIFLKAAGLLNDVRIPSDGKMSRRARNQVRIHG